MANDIGRELDWDSPIENDKAPFELAPDGDYNFTVLSMERGRHEGSAKLPPCPKAVLRLELRNSAGEVYTTLQNLFLHSSTEWRLCAFFTSIGHRKPGERLTMDWSRVVGSTGRAKVIIRTWKKEDGTDGKSNDIESFYEPDAAPSQAKGYVPGRF